MNLLVYIVIYPSLNDIFRFLGTILYICQVIFHLFTMFINQGIPNKNYFISDEVIYALSHDKNLKQNFNIEKFQICRTCKLLIEKKRNVIHCCFCETCCEGYDHHCSWLGKCIGKNNYISFKIMVYLNFILFGYYFVVLILFFIFGKKTT